MRFRWSNLDQAYRVAIIGAVITGVLGIAGAVVAAYITADSPDAPSNQAISPNPSPTPSPAPTPSPTLPPAPTPFISQSKFELPNPYHAAHNTMVLNDPLTVSNGKWANDHSNTGTCEFKTDGLHVGSNQKYHECYGHTSVTDFTYEVQFNLSNARVAGIFFRQSGDGQWYDAAIGRSGTIWIHRSGAEIATGSVGVIDPTAWNKFAVVAVGSQITFYVNGKQALKVTDSTFKSGPIGLITDGGQPPNGENPNGVTIFRNARVWTTSR